MEGLYRGSWSTNAFTVLYESSGRTFNIGRAKDGFQAVATMLRHQSRGEPNYAVVTKVWRRTKGLLSSAHFELSENALRSHLRAVEFDQAASEMRMEPAGSVSVARKKTARPRESMPLTDEDLAEFTKDAEQEDLARERDNDREGDPGDGGKRKGGWY